MRVYKKEVTAVQPFNFLSRLLLFRHQGGPLSKMIDLQEMHNSDYYEPYYYSYLYGYNPAYYRMRGYGYLPSYGTNSYEPNSYSYLFSSPSRSQDSVYQPPKHSLLSKRGTSCYGPQDYSYRTGASCYEPRGYSYLSGPGTGYYGPCGYGYRSSQDPCGSDPIPIGRSGYAYRRRYSCRPICGDPSCYGARIYYPPSYWMQQNRYYGPC